MPAWPRSLARQRPDEICRRLSLFCEPDDGIANDPKVRLKFVHVATVLR